MSLTEMSCRGVSPVRTTRGSGRAFAGGRGERCPAGEPSCCCRASIACVHLHMWVCYQLASAAHAGVSTADSSAAATCDRCPRDAAAVHTALSVTHLCARSTCGPAIAMGSCWGCSLHVLLVAIWIAASVRGSTPALLLVLLVCLLPTLHLMLGSHRHRCLSMASACSAATLAALARATEAAAIIAAAVRHIKIVAGAAIGSRGSCCSCGCVGRGSCCCDCHCKTWHHGMHSLSAPAAILTSGITTTTNSTCCCSVWAERLGGLAGPPITPCQTCLVR